MKKLMMVLCVFAMLSAWLPVSALDSTNTRRADPDAWINGKVILNTGIGAMTGIYSYSMTGLLLNGVFNISDPALPWLGALLAPAGYLLSDLIVPDGSISAAGGLAFIMGGALGGYTFLMARNYEYGILANMGLALALPVGLGALGLWAYNGSDAAGEPLLMTTFTVAGSFLEMFLPYTHGYIGILAGAATAFTVSRFAHLTTGDAVGMSTWNTIGMIMADIIAGQVSHDTNTGIYNQTLDTVLTYSIMAASLVTSTVFFAGTEWGLLESLIPIATSLAGGYLGGWLGAAIGYAGGAWAANTIAVSRTKSDEPLSLLINPAALAVGLYEKPGELMDSVPAAVTVSCSF